MGRSKEQVRVILFPRRPSSPSRNARARMLRKGLLWLSTLLLFVLAYFAMAPDAPNLPTAPEQSESAGRTAY